MLVKAVPLSEAITSGNFSAANSLVKQVITVAHFVGCMTLTWAQLENASMTMRKCFLCTGSAKFMYRPFQSSSRSDSEPSGQCAGFPDTVGSVAQSLQLLDEF